MLFVCAGVCMTHITRLCQYLSFCDNFLYINGTFLKITTQDANHYSLKVYESQLLAKPCSYPLLCFLKKSRGVYKLKQTSHQFHQNRGEHSKTVSLLPNKRVSQKDKMMQAPYSPLSGRKQCQTQLTGSQGWSIPLLVFNTVA